jgi:sugar phosphate isomerase/epimerase
MTHRTPEEVRVRFGIMSMQLESLLPSGVSAQQAIQHITQFDIAALAERLHHEGFNPIELSGDLTLFSPDLFAPPAIERLMALQQRAGVSYTVHLPLWSVEPSTLQGSVRRGSVEALIATIKATWPLRPAAYVLHATGALASEFYRMGLPPLARELILRQFGRNAAASIREILAATGIPSRCLAIETIEFPLDLTLQLAEELDTSICLDTGHLLAGFAGTTDLWDALELCLPRLAEIHLHDAPIAASGDAPGYGTDHQALGRGDLDVGRLLDRLTAAGWDGPIIFELSVAAARESLEHIRRVRPDAGM